MNDNLKDIDRDWHGKEYAFYSHTSCEAFPCHKIQDLKQFNCLFCYCPLYVLGDECGGRFSYTSNGVKDCSSCTVPHERDNYGYVISRFQDIVKKVKKPHNT